MAKSKKSKILAMALCASVMTGIYAAPVMAGKSDTKPIPGTGITIGVETDGTPGTPGNEGLYVYNVGGNTEAAYKVGGTLKISTDDITTALQGANLTLGNLTTNTITTVDGITIDLSQLAAGDLSNSNVKGIKRYNAESDYGKGRTEIEGVVGVNGKNGRFYVLGEDGTQAAVITNDGTARFGARSGVNVRMENGVLSINSEGTNAVASLSKDGLMLSDSVNGQQQTLTAAKIADIQHIEHVGNATVIEQNTAISADGIVVKDPGSGVSTKTKYDGFYVKDKDSKIVSSLEDDGLRLTDQESGRQILNATDIADIKGIDRVDTNNDGTLDTTVIEKTLAVSETGIAMSKGDMQLAVNEAGFAAVKGENAIYLNENGVNLSAGNDNFVSVTQDGIGLQGGTSQVIMNSNNGAVFRNGDKAVNGETVINGGMLTASNDIATTNANGRTKYTLNTVGADLDALETNVGNISGNVAGIKRDDANLLYGDGRTEIEGVVGVNGKNGRFYVLGEDGTQAAVITNDGTARFGARSGVNVRMENGVLSINSEGTNAVASLSKDGLTLGEENLNERQLYNINNVIGDGGVVTAADGSVIGGVGFTSGAMTDVVSINGAAVEGVGNGGLKISGVELENGLINGVNINDLDKAVAGTSANIGGIEREAEDGAASGKGTTTIENNLKVSGNKINMFGDTGLTFVKGTMNDVNVINVSGNIGFNGSNVHFSYGSDGKTTTLGGLALTVDQIANDVSAIKEKTDHITVDDKGNVTISADDGSSLTVGKDGTSTGQGGQVTTDGNHTVNGDLDVDGSGQIDKDLTVGGDLEVGGSITTGNTTIDGSGMTVGDGTTITDGKVSSTEGAFGNITSNTGTIGKATFDENGMTVGTADKGTTVSDSGVSIKNEYGSVETGVVDGKNDVVVTDEDGNRTSLVDTAGRVDNLEQGVAELNNRVGELEDRIDKVGAMAAAIANLRTMGYDPAAPTEVAVGIGQYRDETGAALGLFHYPNRDFMLSLSVSTSGDEVMGGIGATWKFGRKSPEKVAEIKKAQAEADARRAEEAKLAKAEEMKQAAKEAKIKAQQERHAKLAAQAEAAK